LPAPHRSEDRLAAAEGVIVVGAGPVGLVTALALAQRGIGVTVLEAEPALTRDLRAGSFHPPTLEMLAPLGITERLLALGIKVPRWQLRDRHAGLVAEWDLALLEGDTPYPYRLHVEQYKLTPIAHELLSAAGGEVRFATRFLDASQDAAGVIARIETADGVEERRAAWLIGADGGRSKVRKTIGVEFEGFTWPERFLVTSTPYDLAPHGFAMNAYVADPDEWAAVFKMPGDGPPGLWRIAFPIPEAVSDEAALSAAFVEQRLQGFLARPARYDVSYKSIYKVHQRVAADFRRGRILLAGDAAHVNNPLGAMGLNSGIHDAANLAPKLAAVIKDGADPTLLDRYVRQRRQTNIDYIQAQSIRNKCLLEERDPKIRAERLDEARRTAADPKRAYEFLLNSSMIASVRRAETIQ
jgi:3-(3-hydroxy-phenyl)propionate hydroxylase